MLLLLACTEDDAAAQSQPAPTPPAAQADGSFHLALAAKGPQITGIDTAPGTDPQSLWVTTQKGRIFLVKDGGATLLLDISDRVSSGGETGLLGLAVSPRPDDRRVFVNYTYKVGKSLHSRIAAFPFDESGKIQDAQQVLLEYDQPWANHNSGAMTFGSDGMLYLGVGDGGSGGDPKGTGQRTDDFLGSILRIDVRGTPYTVPGDNPLVGQEGSRPEIWAWGVRNPWGMHPDGDTIYFADVGQNAWEEVNRLQKGGNYGWNKKEGTHCYKVETCEGDFIPPLADYGHDVGVSVTGGVVYRGPSIPKLDAMYLYADFGTGAFFGIPVKDGKEAGPPVALGKLGLNPSAFGTDRSNNVYVADYNAGIYRFVPGPTTLP